ncbi:hypothetical protein CDD82_5851 [Ophiocordyceps australis]|uniref:Uncharacterized protein n=1 Tax=Ophiocordyceps australis TaxID=1399860 RepID=A0A2C5Z062_9HYPO|nr:hypothetical protein CDD82_5851 [Ophiocordyceps australis]
MAEPLPPGGAPGYLLSIPPMLGSTDPFITPIVATLRGSCPAYLMRPRRNAIAVARGVPGNLMIQCDNMNYLTDLGMKSLACWQKKPEHARSAACSTFAVADAILNTLPDWFVHVILFAGVPGRLRNRLAADLYLGPIGSRRYQLKWLHEGALQERRICWPQAPSFSAAEFDDVYGFIGALMIDPQTVGYPMPHRFGAYPPGYLRERRFRTVDWRDYDARGMIDELQVYVLQRLREPNLSFLRNKVDLWWGMAGRALLPALLPPGGYSCPSWRDCVSVEDSKCTGPIQPANAGEVLRLLLSVATLRIPLVISQFGAKGVRPNGPWLALPGKSIQSTYTG